MLIDFFAGNTLADAAFLVLCILDNCVVKVFFTYICWGFFFFPSVE